MKKIDLLYDRVYIYVSRSIGTVFMSTCMIEARERLREFTSIKDAVFISARNNPLAINRAIREARKTRIYSEVA